MGQQTSPTAAVCGTIAAWHCRQHTRLPPFSLRPLCLCHISCPPQDSLRASAFYVGDEVSETKRQSTRMAVDTKAPGQAPPDLPSLLLDGRICYIGMPVRARWLAWLIAPSVCAGMQ